MSEPRPEHFEWKVLGEKTPGRPSPEKKLRLGVLVSGNGSNLQAIIDAIESQELPGAEIALVLSNNAGAFGLQRALKHKVPAIYLPWRKFPVGAFLHEMTPNEVRLTGLLHLFAVDLIVLAGWMRIFSTPFMEQFANRVINIHPALLPPTGTGEIYTFSNGEQIPVFRGINAIKMALDAGVHITGCTVHYVTPQVDAGPVICQQAVPIKPGDTEESLRERVHVVEHRLLVEAIRQLST
ncbi:MAG TPA: phosphoribosylglycinamide formyltransferase [Ktedonobacteraceae bacterium]|nr:phosphoribosylglycinamide formyltransferase [Ktedonobacteraceae bacterium]